MSDGDDARPDPDALLALANAEERGKLRIFLGAAPGVGKTYAMLARARAAKAVGEDIVIGLVETHGRAETQALAEGLEILPRLRIDYAGRVLEEFDLDAALKRKPKIIVVDEIAHTNAPDSRHPKRWQDIEDLLDARIDVWTALNIQHIESLSDVVARIAGVDVRETVPDRVVQEASDVILVDVTPEELLQRLKEGKVYQEETAERAQRNFFTQRNLTALRELALRRTADRVDDQMVGFLRAGAVEGPWEAADRILVCVGRDRRAEAVVRSAARLATGLNAPWIALSVDSPRGDAGAEEIRQVEKALSLAERLGATVQRAAAEDRIQEILRFARRENITQIVVGRSRAGALARLLRRSLPDELLRRSKEVAVHVVAGEGAPPPMAPATLWRSESGRARAIAVAATIGAVAATTAVALFLDRVLRIPDIGEIFFVTVVACAARFGLVSGLVAAALSFLARDFFFVPPLYEFTIGDPKELVALVVFTAVASLTGVLASRLGDSAEASRERARTTQTLLEYSGRLSSAVSIDDILYAVCVQAGRAIGAKCAVALAPEEGELTFRAGWPPIEGLTAAELTAARWAFDKNETSGWRTGTLPSVRFQFRPVSTSRGVLAVCGLEPATADTPLAPREEEALMSILQQSAIAIDRAMLAKASVRSAALEENERLRSLLLSSLSHDLRTPLTSILAAASTLTRFPDNLPAADRIDLAASIEEEANRLSGFIDNMLDMSRIESGAVAPRRDSVSVDDVVMRAVARTRRVFPKRLVAVSLERSLPPLLADAGLVERVLFNLLDNACKYGGSGTVSIHARREAGRVVLSVTDEGPGVKPDDLGRIFEKFYRGGRPDGRQAGAGLGLSICRGLVEAMGGTIEAQSPAARRRGLRVVVRLPMDFMTMKETAA